MQAHEIPDIFTKRELFLQRVTERIWAHPSDYNDAWMNLKLLANKNDRRLAAGVLMPLIFRKSSLGKAGTTGSFVILLIKRSSTVAQAGDLSFPGGMLNPIGDRILRYIFLYRLLPALRHNAASATDGKKSKSSRLITLFMTTALREAWEETGLSPFHTELIGPLPTYNLIFFKRTIFPIAGFVKNHGLLCPNSEVEKIVEIPLASFYNPAAIGSLEIETPGQNTPPIAYPCLIHYGNDGKEEILWGATFNITVDFLSIVMDYRLPENRKGPVISRKLSSGYLSAGSPA
ncbi:MAG: CoA pyrophosphatase [Syntrophobacterales bacterium]|nr:CoA pyrophosphatase [Syntrophobacterales bacterium]